MFMKKEEILGPKADFFKESVNAFVISQTYKPFIYLSLKFLILETKICLEMKDVFKFESFRGL